MTARHVTAVVLWVYAWAFAGFIPASFFAAKNGKRDEARAELAAGLLGAAGFALIGAWAW